mmetsp:Transcript_1473/g.3259  ORF Transcript_1473/g.3259 Transcript_1473/m.3259 type:complete len:754 (+) Transcript_1473:147-2408(+)
MKLVFHPAVLALSACYWANQQLHASAFVTPSVSTTSASRQEAVCRPIAVVTVGMTDGAADGESTIEAPTTKEQNVNVLMEAEKPVLVDDGEQNSKDYDLVAENINKVLTEMEPKEITGSNQDSSMDDKETMDAKPLLDITEDTSTTTDTQRKAMAKNIKMVLKMEPLKTTATSAKEEDDVTAKAPKKAAPVLMKVKVTPVDFSENTKVTTTEDDVSENTKKVLMQIRPLQIPSGSEDTKDDLLEKTERVSMDVTTSVQDVEKDVTVKSSKDTAEIGKMVNIQDKKDSSWLGVLGAAAEVAGAIGGVAIKAASTALEDMVPKEVIDVSIPYESASFVAYTEWLVKYNKVDPELERYGDFQNNYKTVTIANVIAKKKIREGAVVEGEEEPKIIQLNQHADLPQEDYTEIMKSLEPKSWGDLIGELATFTGKAAAAVTNTVNEVSSSSDVKQLASFTTKEKKETPVAKQQQPLSTPVNKPFSFLSGKKNLADQKKKPADELAVTENEKALDAKQMKLPVVTSPFSILSGAVSKAQTKEPKDDNNDDETKMVPAAKMQPPAALNKPFSFLSGGIPKTQKESDKLVTTENKKAPAAKQQQQPPLKNNPLSFLSGATLRSKKPPALQETKLELITPPAKKSFFSGATLRSKKPPALQEPKAALKTPPTKKSFFKQMEFSLPTLQASKKPIAVGKKATVNGSAIPALSKWKQNKDGSITGYVSNSPNFKTGTKITTSPVPKNAKAASVVKTDSGSRYRLK